MPEWRRGYYRACETEFFSGLLEQSRAARFDELQQSIGCEQGDLLDPLLYLEGIELVEVDRTVDPWNCIADSSVRVDETPTHITLTLQVAPDQRLELSLRKDSDRS